jgi:DNA-binding transcriptional LysR family regulator
VELRHLRAFLAVAEELSFTRAARALHVTQSTVSKVIRELEGALDVELLERTTREVRLTPAGEALLERAGGVLHGVAGALEATRAVGRGATGRVRVGFSPAIGLLDREDAVRALRPQGSEVSVALEEVRPGRVGPLLRRHEIDLVLTRTGGTDDPAVQRAELRPTPMALAVPANHRLAARRSAGLAEIDGERLLVASAPGTRYTDFLLGRLGDAGASVHPVEARVTGGSAILTQLIEEGAVSLVPAGTAAPGGVRCVPVRDLAAPLWVLWPAGIASSAVDRLRIRLAKPPSAARAAHRPALRLAR